MEQVEPKPPDGMHNVGRGSSRESDGSIVAMKWSNFHGAKGPYHMHVLNNEYGDRLSMTTTVHKVHVLRTKLADKAKREPKYRFYNLYGHILREDLIRLAWRQVRENNGGAGIDNISLNSFDDAEKVTQFLFSIQKELKEKSYRPSAVKRVHIPKANGKLRPLGIPTVKDRVVQAAVRLILEPIFEADFHDCSFGFRPNRSAHQALGQICKALKMGKLAVYDADLRGYFDSIPHDKLMCCLKMRIADRSVLALIKMWLKAPVAEKTPTGRNPKLSYPKKGTPQGGVISPLLANLYLHWFDRAFERSSGPSQWAWATLVRYADDFVILAKYQSQRLQTFVEDKIEGWLGLELNREKTKVVDLGRGDSFDFLGHTFSFKADLQGKPTKYLCMEPSAKALQSAKDSVNEILATNKGYIPLSILIKRLNRFLAGWGQYFSVGYPRHTRRKLNWHVCERLTKHARRRSQRPYRPPERTSYYAQWRKLGLLYL